MNNPFELMTPSKLTAQNAIDLWCDDSRLDRVRGRETCFINGNRGTGKSMLFRVLQPDCQKLLFPNSQPDFLAVYFPVRESDFLAEELKFIESEPRRNAISESHLTLSIIRQLLVLLRADRDLVPDDYRDPFIQLVFKRIQMAFEFSEVNVPELSNDEWDKGLAEIIQALDLEIVRVINYVTSRLFDVPERAYDGPLFFFDTSLAQIADFFFDELDRCLYILVDDGDDLPLSHTIVLNSWIARRKRSTVFKVSTMYTYKTYSTRSGSNIQPPHDFIQYDIATRFIDNDSEDYVELVRQICSKRLSQAGLRTKDGAPLEPDQFFPKDADQEARLKTLRDDLTETYKDKYASHPKRTPSDYVYRHLTSEYMQRLHKKRALDSYRYAGLKTLAILSGGLVRDFIICAQKMYDNASRPSKGEVIEEIPPSIQNEVVRAHADAILNEIDDPNRKRTGTSEDWCAVKNIVEGIGALFKERILSQGSERRVFSFALQSRPSERLAKLFNLAVTEGYLMRGVISRKEGTGRRILYVLTRRVAPAFSLDASAYSGYLSLQPKFIEEMSQDGAIRRPSNADPNQEDLFGLIGPDGEWVITEPDGGEAW